jgi:hypothetical protein
VPRYTLKVRVRSRVERVRHDDLDSALAALELRAEELIPEARRNTVRVAAMRDFEPVQQVAARLELSGPRRLHAGLDVRGDGSTEAWTGRVRRRLLEQRPGETAYEALRRALTASG